MKKQLEHWVLKMIEIRIIPRWIIITLDMVIMLCSLLASYLLRFNLNLEAGWLKQFDANLGSYALFSFLAFIIVKTYAGIVRFTGVRDAIRILVAVALGHLSLWTYNKLRADAMPMSILLINFFISNYILISYRLLVKSVFGYLRARPHATRKAAIFGAAELGIAAKRILSSNKALSTIVVAFMDDDPYKVGRSLDGCKVYASNSLKEVVANEHIDTLILANGQMQLERKHQIMEDCLQLGIRMMGLQVLNNLEKRELKADDFRELNIEDLLEREPIQVHNEQMAKEISGKVIVVTGAAGSIGSELVRQVIKFGPAKMVLIDIAESPLHEFSLELKDKFLFHDFISCVADVRNANRISSLFREHRPDLVFHAAAYKHVPLMEDNPLEAILANVKGTCVVADEAVNFGVKRFIMVSTDKAVNPTNVMGASKRIAEIYVQSLNQTPQAHRTRFITTRFGNVLGSNGSVIPRFKKQIASGGPVTITHPEITRYFMTIPEACQLVMEAAIMGKGGEIFVFDMGQPVKIIDLARKMIRLSGLQPDEDIEICFTGLRPGEKLYEELLCNAENTLPTYNNKIMIAQTCTHDYEGVKRIIGEIIQMADEMEPEFKVVTLMKMLVPEYISNNSPFELIDQAVPTKVS